MGVCSGIVTYKDFAVVKLKNEKINKNFTFIIASRQFHAPLLYWYFGGFPSLKHRYKPVKYKRREEEERKVILLIFSVH